MEFIDNKTLRILVILFFAVISGALCASPYRNLELLSDDYTLDDNDTCTSEYSCLNCTAVRLCIRNWNGSLTKLRDFKCSADTPYCDFNSGTCRETPSIDVCAPEDPEFNCPTDGYYPHPTNCGKYYACVKGVAHRQTCQGDYYYDSKSENCESDSCNTVACTSKSAAKVAYSEDSSYYGYCLQNKLVRFEKCPARFQFNKDSQICLPDCSEPGEQGDPYDCTRYYKCSYYDSSWNLKLFHHQCPKGEVYDALNSHCTLQNTSLSCTSGHTFITRRTNKI